MNYNVHSVPGGARAGDVGGGWGPAERHDQGTIYESIDLNE